MEELILEKYKRKFTDKVGIERLVGRVNNNLLYRYNLNISRDDIKAYINKCEREQPDWLIRTYKRAEEIGMEGGSSSKGRAYLITMVTRVAVHHFCKLKGVEYNGINNGPTKKPKGLGDKAMKELLKDDYEDTQNNIEEGIILNHPKEIKGTGLKIGDNVRFVGPNGLQVGKIVDYYKEMKRREIKTRLVVSSGGGVKHFIYPHEVRKIIGKIPA